MLTTLKSKLMKTVSRSAKWFVLILGIRKSMSGDISLVRHMLMIRLRSLAAAMNMFSLLGLLR